MKPQVRIDFDIMAKTFRELVVERAVAANSTIVYVENGKLVEEDPTTGIKRVLQDLA